MSITSTGRATVISSRQSRQLAQALTLAVLASVVGVGSIARADTYGNNGGTNLSLPSSWIDETVPANTGVGVPGASDIAAWDSNDPNAGPFALGADTTWLGMLVTNPGAPITVGVGANNLTLGASGIDMSNATQNLTLSTAGVTLGAAQTWNVGALANLSVTTAINTNTFFLTFDGAGAKSLSGVISGTGGLTKFGAGNLTLSNAETYTGTTTVANGNFILDFTQATAPSTGILAATAPVLLNGGHFIMNGSSANATSQTIASLTLQTGASSIDVLPGAGQTATLTITAAPVRTVNSSTTPAVNVGGTVRFGTTGSIILPTLNSAILQDAGGNPYATLGLYDWAGTDATGKVIPVTYVTTNTSGTNFDIQANVTLNGATPTSIRFNNNATVGPITVTGNGTSTQTVRGILMTPDSVGATFTGATSFMRPNRVSTAGADFPIIQNSTAGDLTIGVNLGNASSGAPVNIIKSGIGRLVLSNAGNGYTGMTFINEGTVAITANGNLGAVATGNSVVFSGGTLEVLPAATVNLYNGTPATNARALIVNAGGATLQADTGSTLSVSGVISGAGNLTVSGPGTVNLSGANTNTGNVSVNAGTLLATNASGSSATGTGRVNIASGATLGGTGFISGNTNIASGGHLDPGVAGTGTLTLGNLTLNSGSILDYEFGPTGTDITALTGNLSFLGGGINLYTAGTTSPYATNGVYTLFTVAGTIPGNISTLSVLDPVAGITYQVGSSGSNVTLTISGGTTTSAWNNVTSGSWGVAGNWTNGIPGNAGDGATFGNVITAPSTVSLNGDRTVGTIVFNSGNAYTIAQGSGGNLTLNNGSSLAFVSVLNGQHSITAPVVLASSTAISTTNATDSVTFTGVISGTGNVTTSGPGTVLITNNATFTGTTTIANGTLQLGNGGTTGGVAGAIVDNGALVFNRSDGTLASPRIISNTISGSGSVTFNGGGVKQITGANSFTGAININGGTVQIGNATALGVGSAGNIVTLATGTTLDIFGTSTAIGSLTGSGTVDNTSATAATLTFGAANDSPTFSGVIQQTGAGALSLTKVGTGTTTLNNAATFTGGTTISAGSILLNNNNALGNGTINDNSTGGIQLANGITLNNNIVVNNGANEFVGTSGSATLAGTITTAGSTQYRLGAVGALTLTGASTIGYTTTTANGTVNQSLLAILTRGTIVVAGSGSITDLFQAVTIGRSSATSTIAVGIQDNAIVQGVGITLGGLNGTSDDNSTTVTVTGNGTLNAGTGLLNLNNGDTAGSTVLSVSGNGTVAAGSINELGTNQGFTTVNFDGGTLLATASDTTTQFWQAPSASAFPSVNINAGGMKINDGGFNITIAQPFTSGNGADGGITKLGNGSLTLAVANAYTGNTTVNAGTLFVNAAGATSSGAVILNGGTLGGNASISGRVVAGTGAHAINPGATAGAVGTLTVGGLTTNTHTTLSFDLGSPDAGAAGSGSAPNGSSDLLAVAGNLTLGGGSLAITSQTSTGNTSLGYYKVVSYSGTLTGSTANVTLPAIVNNIEYTLDTTRDPGYIDIHRGFVGDATDDGKVDLNDLNVVLNHLGVATSSWNNGNFDGAATIDLNDLNAVLNHLGTSIPAGANIVSFAESLVAGTASPAATPEPASLGLLALGAAALITRRRKA